MRRRVWSNDKNLGGVLPGAIITQRDNPLLSQEPADSLFLRFLSLKMDFSKHLLKEKQSIILPGGALRFLAIVAGASAP
jgi:hypothetical protein